MRAEQARRLTFKRHGKRRSQSELWTKVRMTAIAAEFGKDERSARIVCFADPRKPALLSQLKLPWPCKLLIQHRVTLNFQASIFPA